MNGAPSSLFLGPGILVCWDPVGTLLAYPVCLFAKDTEMVFESVTCLPGPQVEGIVVPHEAVSENGVGGRGGGLAQKPKQQPHVQVVLTPGGREGASELGNNPS